MDQSKLEKESLFRLVALILVVTTSVQSAATTPNPTTTTTTPITTTTTTSTTPTTTTTSDAILTNYWPLNSLNDEVGGANLFGGQSYSFVADRFGSANSAIYFNNGYLQVPAGVYFSGDFTITVWVYFKTYEDWARIIDFGNGRSNDNIVIFQQNNNSLCAEVISGQTVSFRSYQDCYLSSGNLNQWYHIAFVLKGNQALFYVNGVKTNNRTFQIPRNVTRNTNYIGKSNWGDNYPNAIYDEIKIFKGALSDTDILKDYYTISTNIKLTNYWPLNNLNDLIGGANLFGGSNYSYTNDRFCNPNSATFFNVGYLQAPSGVYFSGDFTITAWINLRGYQTWGRVLDFGNGNGNGGTDNILIGLNTNTKQFRNCIIASSSESCMVTSYEFELNQWHHIAYVLKGTTASFYIDGSLSVSQENSQIPRNVTRNNCYIGATYWGSLGSRAQASYDDIKIYKGALSATQILNDYTNNGIIRNSC